MKFQRRCLDFEIYLTNNAVLNVAKAENEILAQNDKILVVRRDMSLKLSFETLYVNNSSCRS